MGKNLKGKECGKGICQRKDGQYYARFVSKSGKRQAGYFATLPEARNWLEDARYQDKHSKPLTSPDMTVDEWFPFWHAELLHGIERFCMHALRHTYATRAIERGVPPKTLQKLLGHASIKTTMDRYVHVTEDSLVAGVKQFEMAQQPGGACAQSESDVAGKNPNSAA